MTIFLLILIIWILCQINFNIEKIIKSDNENFENIETKYYPNDDEDINNSK